MLDMGLWQKNISLRYKQGVIIKRKMINQIESNKIYNVEELAKLLNRTNQTILAYIKEGMPWM